MAQVQRQLYISLALVAAGHHVTVCNRRGNHRNTNLSSERIPAKGSFRGIDYLYCSGTAYYNPNFIIRNTLKLVGLIREFLFITWRRLTGRLNHLFVNTNSFIELKYYSTLARILGIDLVFDYVEQIDSMKSSKGIDKKFDENFAKHCGRITYISDVLDGNLLKQSWNNPKLKVLPLTDFQLFEGAGDRSELPEKYFLYCAGASYSEALDLVIEAFNQSEVADTALVLVIHGRADQMKRVKEKIAESKKANRITLKSDLPFDELINCYKCATALLIPLRDTITDKARFPHKISEYLATGNPIVTTAIGEVKVYFEDGKTAFVSTDTSSSSFAKKLTQVNANEEMAVNIGKEGQKLGRKLFDYKVYSERLTAMLAE